MRRQQKYNESINEYQKHNYYYDDKRYYNPKDKYNERYIRDEEFANNRYEYRGGVRVKKEKFPSNFSKYFIKFVKLTSQFTYIVSITFMLIGLILAFIIFKTNSALLLNNYIGDLAYVGIVFGSLLGIVSSVIFFLMFILLFFNRKGWLRKSKAYFPGILVTGLIFCLSVYVLYISQTLDLVYSLKNNGLSFVKYLDILTFTKLYIFNYLPNLSFLKQSQQEMFWTNIDLYLWITVACLVVCAVVGSIYIKSYSKTIDESEHYFSRMSYR